jgi:ABC-type multidrug transport system fused ATPase/permease subunit
MHSTADETSPFISRQSEFNFEEQEEQSFFKTIELPKTVREKLLIVISNDFEYTCPEGRSDNDCTIIKYFLENFNFEQDNLKNNLENFRILALVFRGIKSVLAEQELQPPDKYPILSKILTGIFLVLGFIVPPLNGCGVANGIILFFGGTIIPLPVQIVIYATFAFIYTFVFLGFDFAKISKAFNTSIFTREQLTDSLSSILQSIDNILNVKKETDEDFTKVSRNTLAKVNLALKGLDLEKSVTQKIVEITSCMFAGIALMCGMFLGVKGGSLLLTGMLSSFVGLSGVASGGIVVALVLAGLLLGLGSYCVLQRTGVQNLISKLFGADPEKIANLRQHAKTVDRYVIGAEGYISQKRQRVSDTQRLVATIKQQDGMLRSMSAPKFSSTYIAQAVEQAAANSSSSSSSSSATSLTILPGAQFVTSPTTTVEPGTPMIATPAAQARNDGYESNPSPASSESSKKSVRFDDLSSVNTLQP